MFLKITSRGFELIKHPYYPYTVDRETEEVSTGRLVQQSSIIGDYPDSYQPGSSAVWIADNFHLNREDVAELVERLQGWLKTGSLRLEKDQK